MLGRPQKRWANAGEATETLGEATETLGKCWGDHRNAGETTETLGKRWGGHRNAGRGHINAGHLR